MPDAEIKAMGLRELIIMHRPAEFITGMPGHILSVEVGTGGRYLYTTCSDPYLGLPRQAGFVFLTK
jgi:hypothetical protein